MLAPNFLAHVIKYYALFFKFYSDSSSETDCQLINFGWILLSKWKKNLLVFSEGSLRLLIVIEELFTLLFAQFTILKQIRY